jgi:hypothetical protein
MTQLQFRFKQCERLQSKEKAALKGDLLSTLREFTAAELSAKPARPTES